MKFYVLSLALVLLRVLSFAQYSDSAQHYVGVASNGTLNKTNSSTSYVLSNILRLGIKKKEFGMNFTNTWLYGEQERKLTNNDYTSTFDFNLYKTFPHFYYWGLANYTTSYSLKINNQYQGGLGVAYNIVDEKTGYVNISDGLLYEGSDIILPDTTRQVYNTYRNSLRLSFRFLIKDIISITGMNFIQSSLSDENDYIIKSNLGLGFKIKKWLTLSTAFSYNRFNRTQKENTLFSYGITIDNYY